MSVVADAGALPRRGRCRAPAAGGGATASPRSCSSAPVSSWLLGPLVASLVARPFFSHSDLNIFAYPPSLAPSRAHLLGTDGQGRDVLAGMVYGMAPTYEVAFLAGILGLVAGTALGVVSGYLGGLVDTAVRSVTDVLLAIPPFAMLVVIAALFGTRSIAWMAVIIALVSWALPARAMRSQVLSLPRAGFRGHEPADQPEQLCHNVRRDPAQHVALRHVHVRRPDFGGLADRYRSRAARAGTGRYHRPRHDTCSRPSVMEPSRKACGGGGALRPIVLVVLFIGLFMVSLTFDEISNPRLARRHG